MSIVLLNVWCVYPASRTTRRPIHRVHVHPRIPGIYLILIPLLESPGIVLVFQYTSGKPTGKGNSP